METNMLTPQSIERAVEHYTALAKQAADEASDREYERRCAAEDAVTLDEVLEELVGLHDAAKAELMLGIASGDSASCAFIYLELFRARERVVARMLCKGN
jgi:hypothetical protein